MSQPLPTYTAAQRPQSTISSTRQHYASSQSWTAGRCQRLLRPITSRIELLRSDFDLYTAAGNPDSVQTRTASTTVPSYRCFKDLRDCGGEDAYWVRGTKRVRRTYSARSKLQDISHTDRNHGVLKEYERKVQGRKVKLYPGEFLVPTPILNRTKSPTVDSSQELMLDLFPIKPLKSQTVKCPRSRYATNHGKVQVEIAETMRRINNTTDAARFKVYQGIYNSLEALLKATLLHGEQALLSTYDTRMRSLDTFSPALKVPRSSSLFSMCLRGLPNHIKEEEMQFAIESEATCQKSAFDTRIISTETYTDLEFLGISETGWKHLKTVVRRHGVLVICDAIEDGLLDADITSALVMLCVHIALPNEAEILLTSLLKTFTYADPKSPRSHFRDSPTLLPLLTLEKFVKYTGRVSYYHRQLMNLITSGSLSITWLGTEYFASIWTSLFRSLSTDPLNQVATLFMTSVLPLLCRVQSSSSEKPENSSSDQTPMFSALDATLASVLTTLLAMSMISVSHRNISQILRSNIIDCQLLSSDIHNYGDALITMANLLGGIEVNEDRIFLKQLLRFLGSKPCQFLKSSHPNDHIPSFVCSVARCCGRGSSGNGFEQLQIMLQRLIDFASFDNSEGAKVLEQIVVDSAFMFADHLPDPEHLHFALHLRTRMHRSPMPSKASLSKGELGSESGFRWEEGINEWVMATPDVGSRWSQEKGVSFSDEDSSCEIPIRPGRKRRKSATEVHKRGGPHSGRCIRVSDLAPDSPEEYGENKYSQRWSDCPPRHEFPQTHHHVQEPPKLTWLTSSRRPFTHMHKLGSEPRCSRQNWKLFENSDDELNSNTPTSPDSAQKFLQELPNFTSRRKNVPQKTTSVFDKPLEGRGGYLEEQSEDELGLGF